MADAVADNEKLAEFLECFDVQLTEIEVIKSIFVGEDELKIENELTIDFMGGILDKGASKNLGSDECSALLKQIGYLKSISLGLKLNKDERVMEVVNLNMTLPIRYPLEPPDVFLSSNGLNREQQGLWNADLVKYVREISNGEQIVYQLIEWLKDTNEGYFKDLSKQVGNDLPASCEGDTKIGADVGSLWLYMHHIYSKNKRKDIINWANDLQLTGFSLPGKPGVVYAEGNAKNIDEYFVRLRRLPWKRISCLQRESYPESSIWKRTFPDFQELSFNAHGGRDYHMDMGKFHLFLKDHNLGDMFAVLFGLKD